MISNLSPFITTHKFYSRQNQSLSRSLPSCSVFYCAFCFNAIPVRSCRAQPEIDAGNRRTLFLEIWRLVYGRTIFNLAGFCDMYPLANPAFANPYFASISSFSLHLSLVSFFFASSFICLSFSLPRKDGLDGSKRIPDGYAAGKPASQPGISSSGTRTSVRRIRRAIYDSTLLPASLLLLLILCLRPNDLGNQR